MMIDEHQPLLLRFDVARKDALGFRNFHSGLETPSFSKIGERPLVARHCEEIGRDPAEIRHSCQAMVTISDDPKVVEQARQPGRPALAGRLVTAADPATAGICGRRPAGGA